MGGQPDGVVRLNRSAGGSPASCWGFMLQLASQHRLKPELQCGRAVYAP